MAISDVRTCILFCRALVPKSPSGVSSKSHITLKKAGGELRFINGVLLAVEKEITIIWPYKRCFVTGYFELCVFALKAVVHIQYNSKPSCTSLRSFSIV